MADQQSPSIVAKIAGAVVAIAAAWAVQKAVNASWKAASGHKPPTADYQVDAGLAEVVQWYVEHRTWWEPLKKSGATH